MRELFSSLGINWRLFAAQGLNFLILLGVLTIFVWRPLLKIIEERRRKIETGLKIGEMAQAKLNEIDKLKNESIARFELEGQDIIKRAQNSADKKSQNILEEARKKREEILKEAELTSARERAESLEKLSVEAEGLLKHALIRLVELDPAHIDSKLVAASSQTIKDEIGR